VNNLRRISKQLRGLLDGNDTFAQGGHQIIKIRRPRKQIPVWVYDFPKIQEMLLRSFPKMIKDADQRKRAGRWARVINLYFRQQWTRGQIADELGMTYNHVNALIAGIKYAAKGLTTEGKKRLKVNRRTHSNRN
jgi:hypothetical protein